MSADKMDKNHPFSYLFCMLTIFVAGSLLFLIGFFPTSQNLVGTNGHLHYKNVKPTSLDDINLHPPPVKYDQIILLIIDALRTDYPNSTNMPFAYEEACDHLQIKVNTPTVTMPRLKSMTTGTISNFIDIVLNLGHTSKLDDSLLHRLVASGKTSVFAGDHTWNLLFPNEFLRKRVNTDSFFVNDFYEGDKNVTQTLKEELNLTDWHLMILHYLGLDHIGHVEGSHSDNIFKKLLEMDDAIKFVTKSANFENQLLLVTGDHGMRNGGSHGGSDKEELYVPLMGFKHNCSKQKSLQSEYNQIDMTATLAVLLDVEIPHSSIGCLIPDFFETFSKEDQLYFYYYNTLHLIEKLKSKFDVKQVQLEDYFPWFTDAKMAHKHFITSQAKSFLSYEKAKQNYIRLNKKISQLLSDSLVRYDNQLIVIALILTTLTALNLLMNVLFDTTSDTNPPNKLSWKSFAMSFCAASCINFVAHIFDAISTKHILNSMLLNIPIAISIYFALDIFKLLFHIVIPPLRNKRKVNFKLTIPSVLLAFFLFHTISLASSSLIEEEHQTWYYLTPSMLVFLTFQNVYNNLKLSWRNGNSKDKLWHQVWNMRFTTVVLLVTIGCRRLNQTGNKWRHLLDIGDILARSENYLYLTLLFTAALFLLLWLLRKYNSAMEMFMCLIACVCVFLYRQIKESSSIVLFVFWASVVVTALVHYRDVFCKRKNYGYDTQGNLVELLKTNLTCCLLISALLHKPHNVILLPALVYTLEKSYQLCDNLHLKDKSVYNRCYVLVLKTVITIFIANMFYFFQGNSNSLTTIDLNPGYIGLSSYNPFIVGSLITLNTYSAPINAYLYLMWHMFATQKNTLPMRQEKEQITNVELLESTEEDLYLVVSLFTATTIMPISVYWCFLLCFRYHLFIYSVFAPKAFYECFHLLVFYLNFIVTNLYFRLF